VFKAKGMAIATLALAVAATTISANSAMAGSPLSVNLSKSSALANGGDTIDVTVSGLTGTDGVFVQFCQEPLVLATDQVPAWINPYGYQTTQPRLA